MTRLFLILLVPLTIAAAQPAPPYERCVSDYQSGSIERAVTCLRSQRFDQGLNDDVERWIESARQIKRVADVEAALFLHTEVFFVTWDATFPPARAPGLSQPLFAQARVIRVLHQALVSLGDHRSAALRTWYLLWESFVQARSAIDLTEYGNYLDDAVRAFPQDAEVLLAAGSHYELRWWSAYDNPQRQPNGGNKGADELRSARDWFRKGIVAPGPFNETRLRLGRVLLMLGDVDEAETELRRVQSMSNEPGLLYVAALLLGDIAQRRGDLEAAAASYEAASKLVPVAQSARLASAYVRHLRGNRKEAAEAVVSALSNQAEDYDPWWLYAGGYSLQFDRLLRLARESVRGASTGAIR